MKLDKDSLRARRHKKWRRRTGGLSDAEFAEELQRWQQALRMAGDTSRALDRAREGLRDGFLRYCSPTSLSGWATSFAGRVEGVRRRFQDELGEMERRYDELINMQYHRLKRRGEIADDWRSWSRKQRFAYEYVGEGEHDETED